MVVEHDLLDVAVERHRLQFAEPSSVRGLDDDQPADRVQLEPGRIHQRKLVGVQAGELADVAVQRARDTGNRVRVEPARGEQRRERVEVGVPMGRDDGFDSHRLIVPPPSLSGAWAAA